VNFGAAVLPQILLSLFILISVGCATAHPSVDFALAREAFNAAKEVEAARYAPGYFHKAEESFHAGERAYKEKDFNNAIEEFRQAKRFAEKAENIARLQRQKAGDEGI
jgi:hypothetical protein